METFHEYCVLCILHGSVLHAGGHIHTRFEVSSRATEKCHLRGTVSCLRGKMNNGTCMLCPPVLLAVCAYVCVFVVFFFFMVVEGKVCMEQHESLGNDPMNQSL